MNKSFELFIALGGALLAGLAIMIGWHESRLRSIEEVQRERGELIAEIHTNLRWIRRALARHLDENDDLFGEEEF